MKTLINALLIGSLMTTVAFAGETPKADKSAPAKKDDTAAKSEDKAEATPTTEKKTDAKKDTKTTKKVTKKPATK